MDLIYFGHENDRKFEKEFTKTIKEAFPNILLENSDDDIKGHRQTVSFNKEEDTEENKKEYFAWIMAKGWFDFSLTLGLMVKLPEKHRYVEDVLAYAQTKYPPTVGE